MLVMWTRIYMANYYNCVLESAAHGGAGQAARSIKLLESTSGVQERELGMSY